MSGTIINILIHGMTYGGMIAILAVGFSLIFGVAKIVNMAHTAFYMIASFIIYISTNNLGLNVVVSAILSILLTSLIGIICYKLFFDRIKQHETAVMIVSVALALLFQEILLIIYGGHYYRVSSFFSGFLDIGSSRVTYNHIFAFGTSLAALVCLWYWLTKTRLGNAIRCVAEDREIANLVGINVSQVCMIVMGISAGLAALGGVVVAPIFMTHSLMWMQPLVMVLAAVVLGGLGSIKGSVIAAFIIGLSESSIIFLVPGGSFLRGAVSLSLMVIVLIIRPEGLYGVAFEEERL
ncbi:MAG: branched-chain amino acid ABC transporter permease [Bacteroidales bacterium]|nr:branched-chain amino acid ABC transporter permease [Bacteroidales bacterium]